jgi:hypothetical protein
MRGVVWRVFLCGVIVGVAMGAAHEQRWGLFTWLLVRAALGGLAIRFTDQNCRVRLKGASAYGSPVGRRRGPL